LDSIFVQNTIFKKSEYSVVSYEHPNPPSTGTPVPYYQLMISEDVLYFYILFYFILKTNFIFWYVFKYSCRKHDHMCPD